MLARAAVLAGASELAGTAKLAGASVLAGTPTGAGTSATAGTLAKPADVVVTATSIAILPCERRNTRAAAAVAPVQLTDPGLRRRIWSPTLPRPNRRCRLVVIAVLLPPDS